MTNNKIKVLHYNKKHALKISIDEKGPVYYFNNLGISAELLKLICEGKAAEDGWYKFRWENENNSYFVERKMDKNAILPNDSMPVPPVKPPKKDNSLHIVDKKYDESVNTKSPQPSSGPDEGYQPSSHLVNPIPPGKPNDTDHRTSKVHERPEPTTLSPGPRGGLCFSTSEPTTFTWDNSEQKGTHFEASTDEQFAGQLKRCLENNTGGIRDIVADVIRPK